MTNIREPVRQPATGRDWQKIVLIELAGLLAVAFLWLLWQLVIPISHTVVLFLLGAALAFVLSDPSDRLGRRLGNKCGLGILVTYLIVFAVVLGGLLLLAVPIARQATELARSLPQYLSDLQGRVEDLQALLLAQGIDLDLENIRAQATNAVQGSANIVLAGLIAETAALGGALTDAALVLVISVYLLAGASTIQDNTLRLVPRRYRGAHEFARTSAARVMGAYMRGQLIMSLVIGVLAGATAGSERQIDWHP